MCMRYSSKSVSGMVRDILKATMSNELMVLYTRTGRKADSLKLPETMELLINNAVE